MATTTVSAGEGYNSSLISSGVALKDAVIWGGPKGERERGRKKSRGFNFYGFMPPGSGPIKREEKMKKMKEERMTSFSPPAADFTPSVCVRVRWAGCWGNEIKHFSSAIN